MPAHASPSAVPPTRGDRQRRRPRCRKLRGTARLHGGLLLAMLAVAAGCSPAGDAGRVTPRDVLLVTLDTTRADRIGAYGAAGAETPVLDALAERGLVFEDALAPTPITLPSHVSILTGTWPTAHGVHDNGLFELRPAAQLLPEVLREAGFRTAAFVGSYVLDARFGLDQGFEHYDDPTGGSGAVDRRGTNRPASAVVDATLRWVGGLADDERFFAWVHFYDPHHPYEARSPWSERGLAPYDSEIAYCDAQLGRLLQGLAARGRARELLVVVTADHGEALGEHGEETHGVFVYQSTLRVPLLLAGPGLGKRAGTRSPAPVSNVSIARTILELLGLDAGGLPAASAPSLLTLADDPARAARESLYLESYLPYHTYRWQAFRGLRIGDLKLIDGGSPELYDLAADPLEQHDRASAAPERVEALRAALRATVERHPERGWVGELDVTSEEEARLEALGYVVGDRGDDPFSADLPPAAERIGDARLLDRAREHFERAQRERARGLGAPVVERSLRTAADLIEQVRRANPHDPEALMRLGAVRTQLGEHEEAAELLEQAVAGQPRKATAYLNLSVVYASLGRYGDARATALRGIERSPDDRMLALWLMRLHASRGETEQARRVVELLPEGSEDRRLLERAARELLASEER